MNFPIAKAIPLLLILSVSRVNKDKKNNSIDREQGFKPLTKPAANTPDSLKLSNFSMVFELSTFDESTSKVSTSLYNI